MAETREDPATGIRRKMTPEFLKSADVVWEMNTWSSFSGCFVAVQLPRFLGIYLFLS